MKSLISSLIWAVLLLEITATASPTNHRGIKQGFSSSRRAASLTHPLPATRLRPRSPAIGSGTYSAVTFPTAGAVHRGTDIVSVSAAITVPSIIAFEGVSSGGGSGSDSGSGSKADYENDSPSGYVIGGMAGIRIGGLGKAGSGSGGGSGGSSGALPVIPQLEAGVMWYGTQSLSEEDQAPVVNYSAYYEWLPGPMGFFSFDISAGDLISVRLEMSSSTSGVAYAENSNTGQTASQTVTGPIVTPTVAGWQVGGYDYDGEPEWEARFDPVTFSGCAGGEADGSTFDLAGASLNYPGGSSGVAGICEFIAGGGSNGLRCNYFSNSGAS